MQNVISSNRIQVTVAGQVFSIPANKMNELLNTLSAWQSIRVSEASNQSFPSYKGTTLING